MADLQTPVLFDPFFGGFVLETLTIGMYGEARNAIREYIQNSFDSIQRAIEEVKILPAGGGLIQIEMAADKKSLVIRDNGAGLPVKNAAAILTRVGASTKSHRRNAGFRGIGRLAGIVFSNTVTFVTKAKGEREQTTVIFNAKAMRDAMTPGKGSSKSAENLLRETVKAFRSPHKEAGKHFFEVRLEGFIDEPDECKSSTEMYDFVSQVAPVPYPAGFPFLAKLQTAAKQSGIPIEEVQITIKDGAKAPVSVTKRFGATHTIASGETEITGCDIHWKGGRKWWAWVGKKEESGSYTDSKVSGLRVRVRNIQIDGTTIVSEIFREHAKTHVRFQDWYIGEIFVDPGALVPNARRDGFEEDSAWKKIKREIAEVVKELGKEAYKTSIAGQLSLEAQKENLGKVRKELRQLSKAKFQDVDRAIKLSKDLTTYQKRVAKASVGADMETAAELHAIGSEFVDIKREALANVGEAATKLDRERIQEDARNAFLKEILLLLEDNLTPDLFAEVQELLVEEYGDDSD
ncbi:ATP-binding protein [Rhizobium leguminosarum]|uniref:ATP-binding protein n=1 Tax=Rhizobium leguminosarum TaxID=384 RepID=UPI00102FD622|nr:ATP-binding protein [Rhizobium leguminosarum]TBG96071.1 hypothetical protein ELG68_36055 [Rhizobium leguminosarum]